MSAVRHAVEGPGRYVELEAPTTAERVHRHAGRRAVACLGVALMRS